MARGVKTGGRKKGTPNKLSGSLKEMICGALNDVGGQEYLTAQAKQNPAAFLTLLGKILPLQVTGDPNEPLEINLTLAEKRKLAVEEINAAFTERGE